MRKIVNEFIIPRCEASAFEVSKGQVLRVIAIEGKQVGDMTALSLHDHREKFSSIVTNSANDRSFIKATKLYSGPPGLNVMLTVVDDKVGMHWIHGRCTKQMYKLLHGLEDHRNCHDNIVESLRPYGISEQEVPFDTFNIFMTGHVDENGHYTFAPPLAEKGDYIDFLAEMDLLVAISACPQDITSVNDFSPKPLKIEIWG